MMKNTLSAPFAGAVTSAAMGITSLITDQQRGRIDMDEFVTQGQILCLEAGIAAIGGALGQTLIPVPIVGSIIGTVTANLVWGVAKGKLGTFDLHANAAKLAAASVSLAREVGVDENKILKNDADLDSYFLT